MTHPPDHLRRPPSAPRRLAVLGLAVVTLVGLTTACDTTKDSGDGVATLDTRTKGNDDNDNDTGKDKGKKQDATDEERQDAMLEFAACMREHGVDMPDPKMSSDGGISIAVEASAPASGGGGPDSAEMKKTEEANKACEHIMEAVMGEPDEMSPEDQAKFRDEQLAYAKCMRDNGVDMPDPEIEFDGGKTKINMGAPGDGGQRIDPNSETFKKATEACESKLGDGRIAIAGGPAGGPTGGVSTGPAFTESGGDE